MTEKHQLLTDPQFETQFQNCTLAPVLFTHEAHLRLAYIHLAKYGLQRAIENLNEQIKHFDAKFGTGMKFNKTLTTASAKVVHHFMKKAKARNFKDLLKEFPRLKHNFVALLNRHYSIDLFIDKTAKHEYLEPDLVQFT